MWTSFIHAFFKHLSDGSKNCSVASSYLFPEIFWFCTDMIESIELPHLVPRQRIDDCFKIHNLH